MAEIMGCLVLTAINKDTGDATSETVEVLDATEDAEGYGTFRVRREGKVYDLVERKVDS